jgi:capreomycidine synthase
MRTIAAASSPRATIFCFPHAGGAPSAFRDWSATARSDVEICVIALPGRESRALEPALIDVEEIADAIIRRARRPFAFFGHSMGALLAFEVQRRLCARQGRSARQLWVSGAGSPAHRDGPLTGAGRWPDDRLMRQMVALGGMHPLVAADAGAAELFLPALRADLCWLDAYLATEPEPLPTPIFAIVGRDDPLATPAQVGDWARYTTAEFRLRVIAGDHFAAYERADMVSEALQEALLEAVPDDTAGTPTGDDRRPAPTALGVRKRIDSAGTGDAAIRVSPMTLPPAPLEDWLRDTYFTAEVDISSSGVHPYTMREVRGLLDLRLDELDALTFRDSRSTGDPDLRAAIASRWGKGDPRGVMATNGSSEALFLLMHALLRPGDEVVVLEPAYHSPHAIARAIGCRVIGWPLRFEAGFRPDLDLLTDLLSPRTRMLVVNFPHNPTGTSVDADAQSAIVAAAASVGAYLVWDAVFADLSLAGDPLPDASLLYERAVTVNTLSKSYGLPGLRVGWLLAPEPVIQSCVTIRDYTTLALSPLVEFVAQRAVERADRLLAPRLAEARANLEVVRRWVGHLGGRVEWVPPDAGVVAFPRLVGLADDRALCQRLMDRYGVLLVPGACFSSAGHVRLGFGVPVEQLRRGLDAVSDVLGDGVPR